MSLNSFLKLELRIILVATVGPINGGGTAPTIIIDFSI
jgi:hypothetical protein